MSHSFAGELVARYARRLPPPAMSALAAWSLRLAVFSLPVLALAVVALRAGLFPVTVALAFIAAALAVALIACGVAVLGGIAIWVTGAAGTGRAVAGFFLGALVLVYPAWHGISALGKPVIHDVTTDPVDPPAFELVAQVRPPDANPVEWPGPEAAEAMLRAYPGLKPIDVALTPEEAFPQVAEVVRRQRWAVIAERSPRGGRRDGRIEAVARTLVLGLRDDVVVRVRPGPAGTRIDIRSASRYGRHDLGANAARIEALAGEIVERFRRR